jgi:hypothetical protein
VQDQVAGAPPWLELRGRPLSAAPRGYPPIGLGADLRDVAAPNGA